MALNRDEKRQLARRGQTLDERLAGPGRDSESVDTASLESVVAEWRENVADGDDEQFRRRLTVDDVDEAELPERLAPSEAESVPEWVEAVDELQTYLETEVDDPTFGMDDDVAFEHLVRPIAEFALERLDAPTAFDGFSESAVRSSVEALTSTLTGCFGHPLFIEFKTFLKNAEVGDEGNPDSQAGYRAFVERNLDDGLRSFFLEYAVLARLTPVLVDQWVRSFEEFAERLERDWATLESLVGQDLEEVTDVQRLGDRHHGGQQVVGVTFASGAKVAYKPRSVDPEVSYNDFLSWFNAESPTLDLRTLDCVARDGYGWVEWVEPAECPDEDAVADYYERVGSLTCLLYALRFADGNIENVVAEGSQPVVLDLEALAQPKLPDDHLFGESSMERLIDESVLRTGIIPMRVGEEMEGTNGIYKTEGEQSGNFRTFSHPNTDAMELGYEGTTTIEGESLAHVDGETFDPREYCEELIAGFEKTYDFLLDNREQLLDDDGPLSTLKDLDVRYFYRSTSTYAKVRRPLLRSPRLRSGLSASVKIELLAKWIDWEDFDEDQWAVYRAERDALWRLDVPRFTVNTSGRDVSLEGRTLESVLDATPFEQVRRRIQTLSPEDRSRQVDYFVTAYDRDRVLNPKPPTTGFVTEETPSWETVAEQTTADILDGVRDAAVRNDDGELVWYSRVNHGDGVYLRPIRDDLYGGRVGVGVFAAAVADTFDHEGCRELASEAVAPIRTDLERGDPRFAEKKIGAAHGLGSLVYGLLKMGTWLDDDSYVRTAEELCSFITEEKLVEDDIHDLIGGAAGAILALLALHRETGDDRLLERATLAGDALVDARTEVDGVNVWETYSGGRQVLNGAGHGVSGIAFALYKLGGAVDAPRFKDVAVESLQFEENHYVPDQQNWPDFRFDSCRPGWCAGRGGVGMTRLGMLEVEERDVLRRDLDRALEGFEYDRLATEDQLCCGNFGRVEFLHQAAQFLDDDAYARRAEELAAGVVRRANERGGYSIPWQTDSWYSESLFLGEPGIGYSMLRLAGADLPCLLLWE